MMPWNNKAKKEIMDSHAPRIPVLTITPSQPYEVLGIVSGTGNSHDTTYNAICASAAAFDADAVIGVQIAQAARTNLAITTTWLGTAIRYVK